MNENSNRIMFQQGFKAGQDDLKKKLLEGMPQKATERNSAKVSQTEILSYEQCLAWNECREQIIQLIERI